MFGRLFNRLAALSLIVCGLLVVAFIASGFVHVHLWMRHGPRCQSSFTSHAGVLNLRILNYDSPSPGLPLYEPWWSLRVEQRWSRRYGPSYHCPRPMISRDIARSWGAPPANGDSTLDIVIPYALLAWTAALLPAACVCRWGLLRWRSNQRHAEGCCHVCGYDLRATPHRCPECGTPALAKGSV